MTIPPPDFALTGVSKRYGAAGGPGFLALRDVAVTIPAGGLTTIAGPSGSGKSTLLALLGLLDRPTTGEVVIAGDATAEAGERARCRMRAQHLGFVFQAFHLMPRRTVLDNVMTGGLYRGLGRRDRYREAHERLHQVGLADKARDHAGTLSGGEQQRTAIARALVGSPRILLCDEPTGNLDTANGRKVMAILTELAGSGASVVIVTHDRDIAASGTCRLHVVDGQVSGDSAN